MFRKVLCKIGIHHKYQLRLEGLFEIQKCSVCSRVFKFEKLTDKLIGLQVDDKIFPM